MATASLYPTKRNATAPSFLCDLLPKPHCQNLELLGHTITLNQNQRLILSTPIQGIHLNQVNQSNQLGKKDTALCFEYGDISLETKEMLQILKWFKIKMELTRGTLLF